MADNPTDMNGGSPIPKMFFGVRVNSVRESIPLPYDLYLMVNNKPTLFRRRGEVLTPERIQLLIRHGGEQFLVPEDQRELYMHTLRDLIRDPDSPTEVKGRFIKESAFLHIHDIFNKDDIKPLVPEARTLIEDMVELVSSDVEAVASLMRLSKHDYYTYNHCVDVAVYSIVLARRVYGDDKQSLMLAGMGGLLHDIGKRNSIGTSSIRKRP